MDYTKIFNSMKPYSMMEEDLYQVILQTSNSAWKRFHLPFSSFTLTSRGQIAIEQRELDNLRLKSIGILYTIPNEPFSIEIQSIKAIQEIESYVLHKTKQENVILTDEDLDKLYPSNIYFITVVY